MTDKKEMKVGALHSELYIELQTQYAINIWNGRQASHGKHSLIGMPLFFRLMSQIYRDSLADNPWADAALVEAESLIDITNQQLQKWQRDLEEIMFMLPDNAFCTEGYSTSPLKIGVHSHTQLGYRSAYLLVASDQIIVTIFQVHHYGLISLKERKAWLHRVSHQIRCIFSIAQRYRSLPVTRQDIASNNANAQQAIKQLGKLDRAILLGTRRSRYSPSVNVESIRLLKSAFKSLSHQEEATKQAGPDDQQ